MIITFLIITFLCVLLFEQLRLFYSIRRFVKDICSGRDSSHGYDHMFQVAFGAVKLVLCDTFHGDFHGLINIRLIVIVALLHDVADYKYDTDGTLESKMKSFLMIKFNSESVVDKIMKIISRISYSKEINMREKNNRVDWLEVLGIDGLIIRNYVSDADKLESLGPIGHERSKKYNSHALTSKGLNATEAEIFKEVNNIMMSKLIGLNDYIYSQTAKKWAKELIIEMCDIHNKWRDDLVKRKLI